MSVVGYDSQLDAVTEVLRSDEQAWHTTTALAERLRIGHGRTGDILATLWRRGTVERQRVGRTFHYRWLRKAEAVSHLEA